MINLNPEIYRSSDFSIIEKIEHMHSPDLYMAENVTDFLDSRDEIEYPWYKDFPLVLFGDECDRAFIILSNVQLTEIGFQETGLRTGFYNIHDVTGDLVADWNISRNVFPPHDTPQSLEEEEGFKDGDWVDTVVFLYLRESGVLLITEVIKEKSRPSAPLGEKQSTSQLIENLLPQPALT